MTEGSRRPIEHLHYDAVSALFADGDDADRAARALVGTLGLDDGLVHVEHVDPAAPEHGGEPVLIAYVPDEQRPRAREVIGAHHGSHVPLDWIPGTIEMVDPDTVG